MSECVKRVLAFSLDVTAVEEHRVDVWVELQVARRALHHGDAAARSRALLVECKHDPEERAGHFAEELRVVRETVTNRVRHREHPLPEWRLGQDALHQIRRRLRHSAAHARWAESSTFTAKRDQPALATSLALEVRKAPAEKAAVEIALKLAAHERGQPRAALGQRRVQRLDVVAHHRVERRLLRLPPLVDERRHARRSATAAPSPTPAFYRSTPGQVARGPASGPPHWPACLHIGASTFERAKERGRQPQESTREFTQRRRYRVDVRVRETCARLLARRNRRRGTPRG